LQSRDGKDPREELARFIIQQGWNLRRLDIQRVNLEALFTDVVLRSNNTTLSSSQPTPPQGAHASQAG
jgi:hypothetical protein